MRRKSSMGSMGRRIKILQTLRNSILVLIILDFMLCLTIMLTRKIPIQRFAPSSTLMTRTRSRQFFALPSLLEYVSISEYFLYRHRLPGLQILILVLFGASRILEPAPHPRTQKSYASSWDVKEVSPGMVAFAAMSASSLVCLPL